MYWYENESNSFCAYFCKKSLPEWIFSQFTNESWLIDHSVLNTWFSWREKNPCCLTMLTGLSPLVFTLHLSVAVSFPRSLPVAVPSVRRPKGSCSLTILLSVEPRVQPWWIWKVRKHPWAASWQICKIAGCACTGNAGNFSPPPRVSDPDIHHGMCLVNACSYSPFGILWKAETVLEFYFWSYFIWGLFSLSMGALGRHWWLSKWNIPHAPHLNIFEAEQSGRQFADGILNALLRKPWFMFRFDFHWSLFLWVQLMIPKYQFG